MMIKVTPGLLTIGRFAQLTRLSVKQLRRYDEMGLLPPATVDEQTGYRFYHRRQAQTAATVALLRELDIPLTVIRELLTADDERAAELLAAQRARQAVELERAVRSLAALTHLGDEPMLHAEVRVDWEPSCSLVTLRAEASSERMAGVTWELAAAMDALLGGPSPPFLALLPLDLPASFEIVLGVEHDVQLPGTAPLELPGGPAASTLHTGSIDTIALSWWPLLAWVHERGLEPTGPVRELYLDSATTRLTVPVQEEQTP